MHEKKSNSIVDVVFTCEYIGGVHQFSKMVQTL